MKMILIRLVLTMTAWAAVLCATAQPLTINTSDTLLEVVQKWKDAFLAQHTEARIQIAGTGTAAAFSALAERKIKLAMSSRSMRYREIEACEAVFGQRPVEYKLAVNAAAVYVHQDNPVTVLTYDELYGIFAGKFSNWKDLGGADAPIVLYGVETNTAAGELFMEEVLNGKGWANNVRIVPGAELQTTVGRDKNSIGFGPFTPGESARPLTIKRVFSSTPVKPSADAISNRIYPISRFLFGYLDPTANQGEIKAFLDWLRGDEGQQIARQAGFYTLPPKWRASP